MFDDVLSSSFNRNTSVTPNFFRFLQQNQREISRSASTPYSENIANSPFVPRNHNILNSGGNCHLFPDSTFSDNRQSLLATSSGSELYNFALKASNRDSKSSLVNRMFATPTHRRTRKVQTRKAMTTPKKRKRISISSDFSPPSKHLRSSSWSRVIVTKEQLTFTRGLKQLAVGRLTRSRLRAKIRSSKSPKK